MLNFSDRTALSQTAAPTHHHYPLNDNVEHREPVSEPAEAPASQCQNVQEHISTQEPQNETAAEKSQPEPEQVLR